MNGEAKVSPNGDALTFDDALAIAQQQMAGGEQQPPGTQAPEAGLAEGGAQPSEGSAGQMDMQEQAPEQALEQAPGQAPPAQHDPRMAQMAAQMGQLQAQSQQLQAQNRQLHELLQEMSQRNQAAVVEDVLTPPVLDFSNMWAEDENVVAQLQAEYAQQMAEFAKKQMMSEIGPLLETAKRGAAEQQRQEALNGLEQVPELAGIMGMTPMLERIIQSNPLLANSDAPIEDKLITAFAIAKGAEAVKTGKQPQKQPGIEEFIAMYSENPDLQKRVEQMRAQNAAGQVANVPPMSASAGAFNAALTTPKSPGDFDDARRLALSRLGI